VHMWPIIACLPTGGPGLYTKRLALWSHKVNGLGAPEMTVPVEDM